MKKTFYILLESRCYREYNDIAIIKDFIIVDAFHCIKLDDTMVLIDGVQLTFNETTVVEVRTTPPSK